MTRLFLPHGGASHGPLVLIVLCLLIASAAFAVAMVATRGP